MPDGKSPHVNVGIECIWIKPGETLTVMVIGPDGKNVAVEIRSAGITGSNVGHVEIFSDEEISLFASYDAYKPMSKAVRERYGIGIQRLDPPVPASNGGK